ncbi:hypothetical protein F889_02190 [Acinetobacter colistiniresistens]|uniref:Uncharacterized protein n=1 Tax=Acinetobacter colistiniresistens TaxID=280145 RepID=N9PJ26_9GAMM|nr:hypothetical protein [Acinetobacter colistiniresistens]ENX33529.1 hypothetical protein F889_02190 [Acinetobacter colistiniresistens]
MAGVADIQVDYMGNGQMQSAFHPYAKLTSIFGKIPLGIVNLDKDFEYNYDFTLPTPVINPYLQVVGLQSVDYSFSPRNEAAGQWRLTMVGQCTLVKYRSGGNVQLLIGYTNPVTRQTIDAYIVYGGFRG